MPVDRLPRNGIANSVELRHGVVIGLLISIPLWVCIGLGIILLILERPFTCHVQVSPGLTARRPP